MQATTANRKRLQRELAEHLREKDRAAMGLLRAKIMAARVERRHRLHSARQACRGALLSLRERQRAERQELTREHQAERAEGRTTCITGKERAKEEGHGLERVAEQEYKKERTFQRQIQRAGKPPRERSTARERSQEDDDAVRSNLPAELVPVFNKHRRSIKGSARRSRTETFLEWAAENPDQVLEVQQTEADHALKELLKQERELGRYMRSGRRYGRSPEALKELLAEVPF